MTTQENELVSRGASDTGRGIKYAWRNQQKSLEKKTKFLWHSKYLQNSTSAFYLLNHRSTARVTTHCSCYIMVPVQLAALCSTNLKAAALLKTSLSVNSRYVIKLRKQESCNSTPHMAPSDKLGWTQPKTVTEAESWRQLRSQSLTQTAR